LAATRRYNEQFVNGALVVACGLDAWALPWSNIDLLPKEWFFSVSIRRVT
jgi:hypothetical protein